jgi:hypothetical protein
MDNNPEFGSVAEFGMDKLLVSVPGADTDSLPEAVAEVDPGRVYSPGSVGVVAQY